MIAWVQLLDRFWFVKAPPRRLALLRVILGIYTLIYLIQRVRMIMRIARSDPALFKPVGVVAGLQQPLPARVVRTLLAMTLLANVAFILGWRHKVSGPLFSGLLLWLLCYRNSWSMIYHNDNALVLHALVLGLTRSADALALDARESGSHRSSATDHWRYGWPIQLMNTVTTLTYFLAGVAKVAGPLGKTWASGEALRGQIAVDGIRKELLGSQAAPLAFTLYDRVALFQLTAWASLVTELLAPLVLLDGRLARVWAGGAFLMHWGIFVMMRITFRYQLSGLIFAPFFDLERLVAPFEEWLYSSERDVGAQDGAR